MLELCMFWIAHYLNELLMCHCKNLLVKCCCFSVCFFYFMFNIEVDYLLSLCTLYSNSLLMLIIIMKLYYSDNEQHSQTHSV